MNIVHKIENAPIEVFTEENCKSPYLKYINTHFTDFEKKLFLTFSLGEVRAETECIIDLDDFWQWMGFSQKAKAKRAILRHLTLNESYTIQENTVEHPRQRGGHNKEKIFVNVNGFKKLSFICDSPRSDEITAYFLKFTTIAFKMLKGDFDE
jgi:hypothetical protein